jgi:hypothetical protein
MLNTIMRGHDRPFHSSTKRYVITHTHHKTTTEIIITRSSRIIT